MLLLHNATIYTLDPNHPRAGALLLDAGRIVAVGRSAQEFNVPSAHSIDLGGRVVIPGLTDAHLHLELYSLSLARVDCETATRQECLERVAATARRLPPGAWIIGHGWNQNNWPEGYGSAADLDAVTLDHPAYLTAKSLHMAWVNSKALQLAGLTSASNDPEGGRLGRLEKGDLSGILYENAMACAADLLPEPELEQVLQAMRFALPSLLEMGLTGVHDFDRRRSFQALQLLHRQEELPLRVLKSVPLELLPHAAALGLSSGFGDDFLRIGSVKAFADGALGPHTAALLQPYEGETQERGMLLMDAEELVEHGRLALESGLSMAVHAIGDRANHEMLKGFAQLRQLEAQDSAERAPLRHRIEHVQVLHPQDAHRLAELGLIASMQPIHATSDMEMAERALGARIQLAYAWRTQAEKGVRLVFGSDAPVESPNPFKGIHAAVTRCRADGSPGPQGWVPEQRLSVLEALHGFTTGPAFAAGMEQRLGQLASGFLADLLVLETDPFLCPPQELKDLKPVGTMVQGAWRAGPLPFLDGTATPRHAG